MWHLVTYFPIIGGPLIAQIEMFTAVQDIRTLGGTINSNFTKNRYCLKILTIESAHIN